MTRIWLFHPRIMVLLAALCSPQWAYSQSPETESRYIRDDLFVYLHTGPGRNYRILGSINAGTAVTLTSSQPSDDFIEIVDSSGRQGWVERQYVSQAMPATLRIETLEQQAAEMQASVAPLRQQLSAAKREVAELKQQNKTLSDSVAKTSDEISRLQQSLTNQTTSNNIRWMLNGGALVGGGLLVGVILMLIPKRRKRSDGWVN